MGDDDTSTPAPPPKRSKTPTWVGTVVGAKDEQIAAAKEAADDKEEWLQKQQDREGAERQRMSENLYKLSEERAADMQKALDGKDTTIKRLWIANIIQVLILAALAGVTVSGNVPGFGPIGLDAAGQPAHPPAHQPAHPPAPRPPREAGD